MIPVADPFTKCSLRREQTPQLAILDTFRSGVTAALQQAEDDEEVWLEVLGPRDRNPQLYPGGPRGILTGSFSNRTQGAFFQSSAILQGWNDRGVKSFWYSLMGVDRTADFSNERLMNDVEALRECPNAKIPRATRVWLMTSGCLDRQKVNGRWDILYELFDNTVVLTPDEKLVLTLFLKVTKPAEACVEFCMGGSSPESFEAAYKSIKHRKWLTSITTNTSFTINSRGRRALDTGKSFRQINTHRGKRNETRDQ
jgi:hypothetical protein